jgi:hypothetical protein
MNYVSNTPKIKVDENCKSLNVSSRRLVSFNIGSNYYVSFGNKEVKQCRLIEHNVIEKRVSIELQYPKSYRTKMGLMMSSKHILFEDEIGDTPEHAVENQVTL